MTIDQQTIVRYLLGELSQEQEDEIEEKYFEDNELFARVANTEDELILDYLNDRLDPQDRELFVRNILSQPEKRKKVEFMKGFIEFAPAAERESFFARISLAIKSALRKLTDSATRAKGIFLLAPVFAAIFLTIVSVKLYRDIGNVQSRLKQQQAERSTLQQQAQELQQQLEQQSQRSAELAQQLQQEQNQRAELESRLRAQRPPIQELLAFELYPGNVLKSSRSGNTLESLEIERDAQVVQLLLFLDDDTPYPAYHITLETVAGDTLWSQVQKTPARAQDGWRILDLLVPATLLSRDDYLIQVFAQSAKNEVLPLASYPLRILVK